MTNVILPKIKQQVEDRQADKLERHSNWAGSVDGWTDITSNSLYGVMAADTEEQHYIDNLSLDGQRHTSKNLLAAFVELMGDRIYKIKAIVTDNENKMVCFRKELCDQFSHILNLRCVLHTLNLVCQDVVQSQQINKTVQSINAVVVFFSNSQYWRQKLVAWGKDKGLTAFLSKYCETRWYSFVAMCMKCSEYEGGFRDCVDEFISDPKKHPTITEEVITIVNSDIFDIINFLIIILKPISDSVAILEGQKANISDMWKCFITINNFYKTLNIDKIPQKYVGIGNFVAKRLNDRSGDFNTDPYLIAFYLSPLHRKICTSLLGFKKMCKMIAKRIEIWNKSFNANESGELRQCLDDYQTNSYPHHSREENPIKYWENQPSTILSRFALEILSLLPSSASLERLFSKLSRTKTKSRSRMTVDRLTSTGKIKLDALNDPLKPNKEVQEYEGFPYEPFDPDLMEYDEEQTVGYIDSIFDTEMTILLDKTAVQPADENVDTTKLNVNIDEINSDSD